ncbi:MAG TPA: gamma-glutamyltransferase, partial [Bryobacteraceae bacterium]|nr:gamma-glutamyltransferase [Bryobacteraceae bacterium]
VFQWSGTSVETYVWQLSTVASFATIHDSLTTTATAWQPAQVDSGRYYWRVAALNRYGGVDTAAARYLGDGDFVKLPLPGLLDPAYVASRRATIDPDRVTPSGIIAAGSPAGAESTETTHFNVIDAEGNAVTFTYTINNSYGSGVTVPGLGFLLNNEMDDFAAEPGKANMFGLIQGEANAIAPAKRPLSAMTPTIVTKDGKLYLVLGAPGGPRIISGVLQVMLNMLDFGMNVQQAVDQPRLHHQWMPDTLYLERGFSPDTRALLQKRGHKLADTSSVGSVEAIAVSGGWLEAAQNGRSAGKAAGY